MLKISCLHTAQSDIAVFEAARRELKLDGVMLRHRVRADLLERTEAEPQPSQALLKLVAGELVALARGADALLLTCPTLGWLAAPALRRLPVRIVRADAALAAEAAAEGGRIIVLCTSSARIARTRALFEDAAFATSASVEVRVVPGARELQLAGREDDFLHCIAEAADEAAQDGPAAVALAEVAMSPAAHLTRNRTLTPARSGVGSAAAAARAAAAKSP